MYTVKDNPTATPLPPSQTYSLTYKVPVAYDSTLTGKTYSEIDKNEEDNNILSKRPTRLLVDDVHYDLKSRQFANYVAGTTYRRFRQSGQREPIVHQPPINTTHGISFNDVYIYDGKTNTYYDRHRLAHLSRFYQEADVETEWSSLWPTLPTFDYDNLRFI